MEKKESQDMLEHNAEQLPNTYAQEENIPRLQLDMFSMLDGHRGLTQVGKRYSNSITIIDLMPRFYRGIGSRIPISKAGSSKKSAKFENRFRFRGEECICTVSPAIIEDKDPKNKETIEYLAFPSSAEELIEKVIFMIASTQGVAKQTIGGNTRYVVTFSLYQIKQYLKEMKSDKSYKQIKQSLLIIRDSSTRISKNNGDRWVEITKDVWADSVIEVSGNGRGRDKCCIAFSDFVVEEILNVEYRQVVFSRYASNSKTFTRYLDLYLSNMWINANINQREGISLQTIMESYGKRDKSMITKRRDMREGLKELTDRGVIKFVPSADSCINEDGEEDFIYYIEPTDEFVEEMIKANAKKKGLKVLNSEIINGTRANLPKKISPIYSL